MEGILKQLAAVTIDVAGTQEQVTTSLIYAVSVLVSADSANTGKIYVGDADVDSTNGVELDPGESMSINAESYRGGEVRVLLSDIYVDTATNGNKARVSYIERVLP